MSLTLEQQQILGLVLDSVLTDTLYALLLGLDGAANIGGVQELYKISDENGNSISDNGSIEGEAYDAFHGNAE